MAGQVLPAYHLGSSEASWVLPGDSMHNMASTTLERLPSPRAQVPVRHSALSALDAWARKPRPLQRLRLYLQDDKGQSSSLALEIHASGLLS